MAKRRRPRPQSDAATPHEDRRRLAYAVLALLGALVVVALVRACKPEAKPAAVAGPTGEPRVAATSDPGHFGFAPATSSSPAPSASAAGADPPPVIDEIKLEKTEVCSGEENLVTIKAHTVNGTDEFLHYVVDDQMGQSSAVRLWRDDDGEVSGKHWVTVFGRGNVATTVPLPEYEVKNCRPQYLAAVETRLRPNTTGDFQLYAKIIGVQRPVTEADKQRGAPPIPPPPKPFKVLSYTWDFGDGQTATTFVPDVEHDYEGRSQATLYSYYVVGVDIRGTKREHVSARTTLALINPAFETLKEKGMVVLMIALDPRFPELGSDGKVTQHVRIWHAQHGPVTIDRAVMTKYFVGAAGETKPEEVDVGGLLGTATIPPGKEGITTTIVLDTQAEPDTFSMTYALTGTSAEGYPAVGSFSVMKPPRHPGPDAGNVVTDPMLEQKILKAREMLGKDTVTDEDLWQLEKEGAFASLKVTPEQAAAAKAAARAAALRAGPPSTANAPP